MSLQSEQGVLKSQEDIMKHVVQFWKQLFGCDAPRNIKLNSNF